MITFKQFLQENEFLTEAYDYKQMFSKYLEIFPDDETIDNTILWSTHNLKKNIRIIWYLQWYSLRSIYRIYMLHTGHTDIIKLYSKKLQDMAKKCNKSVDEIKNAVETLDTVRFSRQIKHYYDLNLPEINEVNPAEYTPDELFAKFDSIEKDWSDSVDGTINYTEQPLFDSNLSTNENEMKNACKLVLDLGNNWYWVDLNKSKCDLEGTAMGHCGTGSSSSTLISLRKLVKRRADESSWLWESHVTFELTDKSALTQMKGKQNDKPDKKYHPAIIKLLTYKEDGEFYIKDIIGGGYRPETNFSLDDLSESLYDDLIKIRPELMSLKELYKKDGITDVVLDKITNIYEFEYLPEEKCFMIDKIKKGIWDFVDDYGNLTATYIKDIMNGDDFLDIDNKEGDHILQELDRDKVLDWLNENYPDDKEEWEDDPTDYIKDNVDEIWDECVRSVTTGVEIGTENEMYNALKMSLEDIIIQLDGDSTDYVCYIDEMHETDDSCIVKMTTIDAINFIDEYKTELGDHTIGYSLRVKEPYYGFGGYDVKSALEYAKDDTEIICNLI